MVYYISIRHDRQVRYVVAGAIARCRASDLWFASQGHGVLLQMVRGRPVLYTLRWSILMATCVLVTTHASNIPSKHAHIIFHAIAWWWNIPNPSFDTMSFTDDMHDVWSERGSQAVEERCCRCDLTCMDSCKQAGGCLQRMLGILVLSRHAEPQKMVAMGTLARCHHREPWWARMTCWNSLTACHGKLSCAHCKAAWVPHCNDCKCNCKWYHLQPLSSWFYIGFIDLIIQDAEGHSAFLTPYCVIAISCWTSAPGLQKERACLGLQRDYWDLHPGGLEHQGKKTAT